MPYVLFEIPSNLFLKWDAPRLDAIRVNKRLTPRQEIQAPCLARGEHVPLRLDYSRAWLHEYSDEGSKLILADARIGPKLRWIVSDSIVRFPRPLG